MVAVVARWIATIGQIAIEDSGEGRAVVDSQHQGFRPEIFVALCGAAGTDLTAVCKLVGQKFAAYGYRPEVITLSKLFAKFKKFSHLSTEKFEDVRISASMDAGNQIRMKMEEADAAARIAIGAIRELRENSNGKPNAPQEGVVYIIKSLKNKAEYETLSKLYRDAFLMISVYESKESRIRNLQRRIAKSRKSKIDDWKDIAVELIDRDQDEVGNDLGQSVGDVFQLGDAFIAMGKQADAQIERVVKLIFGAPFITPTREEYGMFHAYGASLKSADLSRQVGAVVFTPEGEVIASGCNEVPKSGGGMIWEEDISSSSQERRDFGLGYDASALMKREILGEIISTLKDPWFKDEVASRKVSDLVDEVLKKGSSVSL